MASSDRIEVRRTTGNTYYALIWRPGDLYVWDVGDSAFEAPGTWNAARVGACDIPLTELTGTGWFYADVPATLTGGDYYVEIVQQAGAAPDPDNDTADGGFTMSWTGSRVVTGYDRAAHNHAYLE